MQLSRDPPSASAVSVLAGVRPRDPTTTVKTRTASVAPPGRGQAHFPSPPSRQALLGPFCHWTWKYVALPFMSLNLVFSGFLA